jgi:hypothetical protein
MAITYHSGRRIQATQADFDGTPVVSGGWKEVGRTTIQSAPTGTATITENFTSYASQSAADAVWANNGNTSVGQVNIGTDVLDATGNVSTVAGVVRDIGAVGSTFVLRFKIVITTATQYTSGAVSAKLNIGLFSTNEDGRSAEEIIAVDVNAFDNKYRFKAGGSITADAGGTDGAGGYTTETRYVEIKRLSGGNCKLSIFTSDAYTTSVLEGSKTLTPTGTITSALRYLGVKSGNSGSGDGTVVLTIDDISFWNNTTYVATGDALTVSGFADKRYYMFLYNAIPSGEMTEYMTFGSSGAKDTDDNYANRVSKNGASSGNGYNTRANIVFSAKSGGTQPEFGVSYIGNKSNKEKLLIGNNVNAHTAGAGQEPDRTEFVGKHVQTSNPLNVVSFDNTGTGDYASGTECVVLGYDPEDTHTDNFWEQLYTDSQTGQSTDNIDTGTFTNKKYLWVQLWCKGTGDTTVKTTFNNSTDSTYAYRASNDGGSEIEANTQANFVLHNTKANDDKFINMFIVNNGSNEVLGFAHTVEGNADGVVVPKRRETAFKRSTVTAITDIEFDNDDSGSFTDWELTVWGSN